MKSIKVHKIFLVLLWETQLRASCKLCIIKGITHEANPEGKGCKYAVMAAPPSDQTTQGGVR